ncbi:excinuclease ABC subunit B [Candidatus Micrarchaeota archaeon CG1_02_51_15]|nr:MAG: excinuclease ABC subunit B [Candidatus Micrarchaeota archaeon CG1_02_51_15]
MDFFLESPYSPAGSQPRAIRGLGLGLKQGGMQTLLGITGSGKTFTMANVIAQSGRSALVLSHNKTLAAQLYAEFQQYFPKNNVGYFISYYDYYRPESYAPQTDTYIGKESERNEKIEQFRLQSTSYLLSREPTVIVASVSCIFGLGNPVTYGQLGLDLAEGAVIPRRKLLHSLVEMQYSRNDAVLGKSSFRLRGDLLEVMPPFCDDAVRVRFEKEVVKSIEFFDPLSGVKRRVGKYLLLPAKHFVVPPESKDAALESIKAELDSHAPNLAPLERQRIVQRTEYDLEMIREIGYCSGIENYSRHFDGRKEGEKPFCLLDYFPKDFLMFVDESHVTLPQLQGMYNGDRARKQALVDFGFRLPSAFDNRPLKFSEFEPFMKNAIFVSATPAQYELSNCVRVVEQIVRPTGLLDPEIEVRKTEGQLDDLLGEISARAKKKQRTLVTTLTKRMAEDLAAFLHSKGARVRYLHSELDAFERIRLLRSLRLGEFDALVGVNLLREGLDLPEVSLVAVLDADKTGFLRSAQSLIQTVGRAARNSEGKVVFYADLVSQAMKEAMQETARRRKMQFKFNKEHGIIPKTIVKPVPLGADAQGVEDVGETVSSKPVSKKRRDEMVLLLEEEMKAAAECLNFERAIALRNKIRELRKSGGY